MGSEMRSAPTPLFPVSWTSTSSPKAHSVRIFCAYTCFSFPARSAIFEFIVLAHALAPLDGRIQSYWVKFNTPPRTSRIVVDFGSLFLRHPFFFSDKSPHFRENDVRIMAFESETEEEKGDGDGGGGGGGAVRQSPLSPGGPGCDGGAVLKGAAEDAAKDSGSGADSQKGAAEENSEKHTKDERTEDQVQSLEDNLVPPVPQDSEGSGSKGRGGKRGAVQQHHHRPCSKVQFVRGFSVDRERGDGSDDIDGGALSTAEEEAPAGAESLLRRGSSGGGNSAAGRRRSSRQRTLSDASRLSSASGLSAASSFLSATSSDTSSSSSSSSSSEDDESVSTYSFAPPDGGWGWVVVLASFLVNMIADGVTFSFGVIFVELQEEFEESRALTAGVVSLFHSVPLLSGPVASALVDRYGCRRVTIVGALLACVGFLLSATCHR